MKTNPQELKVALAYLMIEQARIMLNETDPLAEAAATIQRLEQRIKELELCRARLEWLHDCSGEVTDEEGFEWGIFRVKWVMGRPVEVWQTNSDFSDLDAAMIRERRKTQ